MFRYADDVVLCFELREDAERVLEQLRERLAAFGLRLNAEKTRLLRFGRRVAGAGGGRPETFDFLGFTHYVGTSLKGKAVVKRRTMGSDCSGRCER